MVRALALFLALLLAAASCVEAETGSEEELPGGAFKVVEPEAMSRFVYVSEGRLMLVEPGRKPHPLSERGVPELPISGFDLCAATGEIALAHGGSVGVVPLEPEPRVQPRQKSEKPAEEWYSLREAAGSDFFVSLIRISPDGLRLFAGGYGAGSVEEGFRLFLVDRAAGGFSAVELTEAQRTMMLIDATFDATGAAYVWLSDENIPDSIIYSVEPDGLQRICGVEELLGTGTGEDYAPGLEGLGGLISVELLAFVPRGDELLLVVYPLEQDAAGEPVGHSEFWRYRITGGQVAERINPAANGEDFGFIFSTASAAGKLYFARLLSDEGEAQEVRLGALDYASGELAELCSLTLEAHQVLHSASIFPDAREAALALEADGGYLINIYGFDGRLVISGVRSAGPGVVLLPPRAEG